MSTVEERAASREECLPPRKAVTLQRSAKNLESVHKSASGRFQQILMDSQMQTCLWSASCFKRSRVPRGQNQACDIVSPHTNKRHKLTSHCPPPLHLLLSKCSPAASQLSLECGTSFVSAASCCTSCSMRQNCFREATESSIHLCSLLCSACSDRQTTTRYLHLDQVQR